MIINEIYAGTLEDPISYNDNMELFIDLYYIQNEINYKSIRSSGVSLYHSLADLVGNYVEIMK